jgi:hypothetical protein
MDSRYSARVRLHGWASLRGKLVGVARIELATPAMSTPAPQANLLIFPVSAWAEVPICPMKSRFDNGSGSD